MDKKLQAALKEHMRKLASAGGKLAASRMTKKERSERAKAAGLARQAKARAESPE